MKTTTHKLLAVVLLLGMLLGSVISSVAAEETAECSTTTVSTQVVEDWVKQELNKTVSTYTLVLLNFIIVDADVHIEAEYTDSEGQTVHWSGTMTTSDSCTEAFVSDHTGWVCPASSVVHDINVVLEEGEEAGLEIVSFEAWKETKGRFLVAYYTETELYGYYYSYVISLVGTVTTTTLSCTPPPWKPGVMESMQFVVTNPAWFGQWVSFYWENPEGALTPIMINGVHAGMNITQWGDVSLVLAREDRQAVEAYNWYQTDLGPVQVNTIVVAVLNGQVIQRSLVTPNDASGEPDIYVLSADKVNQAPRLWTTVNWAWR